MFFNPVTISYLNLEAAPGFSFVPEISSKGSEEFFSVKIFDCGRYLIIRSVERRIRMMKDVRVFIFPSFNI